MKYVAAFALAYISGNTSPSAADVAAILKAIGADVDQKRIDDMIAQMKGQDVASSIQEKLSKLAAFGGAPSAAAATTGGPGETAAAEEEKPVEEEEEEEDDFGFDLFG